MWSTRRSASILRNWQSSRGRQLPVCPSTARKPRFGGTFWDGWSVTEAMDTRAGPAWIRWSIIVGAVLFVFALLVSAVFEPKIRILHTLQALIYFALIALTRRNSAWGYGAGYIISAFW